MHAGDDVPPDGTSGPTAVAASLQPPSLEAKCLAGLISELFGSAWDHRTADKQPWRTLTDTALLRAVPASVAPVPWHATEDEAAPEDLLVEQTALSQPEGAVAAEATDSHNMGMQFFREAMARLQLQADMPSQAARVQAIAEGPDALVELETEKARVKAELKRFDLCFERRFNRPPVRQEKEPLRPCYMYYRRLKWAIKQAETQAEERNRAGHALPMIPNDVELQLERLQHEKSTVRAAIQRFQEEFIKTHGRPIKYHKDVVQMENEYRQYKQLRDRIAKLEDVVRRRRALQASLRNSDGEGNKCR